MGIVFVVVHPFLDGIFHEIKETQKLLQFQRYYPHGFPDSSGNPISGNPFQVAP